MCAMPCAHCNAHLINLYVENPRGKGRVPADFVYIPKSAGLDFSMLTFPVDYNKLEDFEDVNQIGVFVYEWQTVKELPSGGAAQLVRQPEQYYADEVTLLVYNSHYVLIPPPNRGRLFGEKGQGDHLSSHSTYLLPLLDEL